MPPACADAVEAERFDCADAFDLVALLASARCAVQRPVDDGQAKLQAVRERLLGLGLATSEEFGGVRVTFCPLTHGTGMTPSAAAILLDDGLLGMSVDGLAEILAHELEHVRQFRTLGARGFKCAYVRAMSACAGCQDRRHALERPAYERQDAVRERLLKEAGVEPPG